MSKDIHEMFNFKDLPRDGIRMIPERTGTRAVENFLLYASSSAYVIVPKQHWVWLLNNGLALTDSNAGTFVALPMTPGNMTAGIVGKVGSTMVFSDVYASPEDCYEEYTPISFAPLHGEYMRVYEHSRCPYFLVNKKHLGIWCSMPQFMPDEFIQAWRDGSTDCKIASICIPANYWIDFYPWVLANHPDDYILNNDPNEQMVGYHGLFRNIPVYTDAFLSYPMQDHDGIIYFELKRKGT